MFNVVVYETLETTIIQVKIFIKNDDDILNISPNSS